MIIIKTPQPDTEERLVLVPPESCTPVFDDGKQTGLSVRAQGARDATPADLERGGWVRDGDLLALTVRAEKAEGLLIQRETELRLAREDGAAVERQMREARSAADASFVRANRAEMRAEKAERELAAERYEHGSTLTSRDMIHNKLAQAERERDEAKAGHNAVQADLAETVHERDTLRAELARLTAPGEGEPTVSWFYDTYCARPESTQQEDWRSMSRTMGRSSSPTTYAHLPEHLAKVSAEDCADAYRLGVAHERARQATDPRMKGRTLGVMLDECEDLEALEQDAYVAPKSREGLSLARKIAKLYAAARHAEARQQPAKDRATDEELVGVMRAAVMAVPCLPPAQWEVWLDARDKAGVRAVAAHVRQERCLVAQAVGMGADLHVVAHGGADERQVTVAKGRHMQRAYAAPAEVPSTLARLLGEVSRG